MTFEEADELLADWSHRAWVMSGWQASDEVEGLRTFLRETADTMAAIERDRDEASRQLLEAARVAKQAEAENVDE